MNIYPSRGKQNITTDVYIDGTVTTAQRVDVDRLLQMPFSMDGSFTIGYLCSYYNNTVCLLYSYSNSGGSLSDGDGLYVLDGRNWVFYPATYSIDIDKTYDNMIFYNNGLHVFRRNSNNGNISDKIWNGSQLIENGVFSSISAGKSMVEYHNELYALGIPTTSSAKKLLKLNMENHTFDIIADAPNTVECLVVYDNEIHMLGGTSHYKWDGTTISSVSTIPISIEQGIVVLTWNNKIHIFKDFLHYSWDGIQWSVEPNSLFKHQKYSEGIVYNNKIYLFGQSQVRAIETVSEVSIKDVTI